MTVGTRNRFGRLIAIVQVYGAAGLVYLIVADLWHRPLDVWMNAMCQICLVFAGSAAVGGIRLWQRTDVGVLLSLIVQGAQVLTVQSSLVSYTAVLGVGVSFGISATDSGAEFVFDALFGRSALLYSINVPVREFSVRVNVLAGFFALMLLREYMGRIRPPTALPSSSPMPTETKRPGY